MQDVTVAINLYLGNSCVPSSQVVICMGCSNWYFRLPKLPLPVLLSPCRYLIWQIGTLKGAIYGLTLTLP